MGWSCRADAGYTDDEFRKLCVAQTGQSNVYQVKGVNYFLQQSNKEHNDGAITGSILRMEGTLEAPGLCYLAGSYRINGDGTIARGPAILKQAARIAATRQRAPLFQVI